MITVECNSKTYSYTFNIDGSYTGLMLTLNLLDKDNNKVRETTGWIYTEYLGKNIWEF